MSGAAGTAGHAAHVASRAVAGSDHGERADNTTTPLGEALVHKLHLASRGLAHVPMAMSSTCCLVVVLNPEARARVVVVVVGCGCGLWLWLWLPPPDHAACPLPVPSRLR